MFFANMTKTLLRRFFKRSHRVPMRMCSFKYAYREPGCPNPKNKPPIMSADEAVKFIKPGNLVFCSGAAATPNTLIKAMVDNSEENCLKDVTVFHMHTDGPAPYTKPECSGIFRSVSLFMGANVRQCVAEGRGDNMPIMLKDIPSLFYRRIFKPDVALIHCSWPDKHGYCSHGTSVDCVRAACRFSKIIIAQVNKKMPRTFGDSSIHSTHFTACVEIDEELPVHAVHKPNEIEAKIGSLIANELVVDGATLQTGIGNIPDAVLTKLKNHKDLGIHSEMFANGVVDLVNRGCVTNRFKLKGRGRLVGSFMMGNKTLYDFVDNNPFVQLLSVDYVNSAHVIRQLPNMTAINSCLEVDLTGQACSDSIGTRFYSGVGGQVDFMRGSAEASDGKGKPILCMPSITRKGESKIVPILKPGAGVVTSRALIHYLVTEYGIAYLFGKTMRQRAYALIQIAHPKHRAALEKASFERLKQMPSP